MIVCRSASELRRLRDANQLVGRVLHQLRQMAAPGVSTADLDALAEREIRAAGAVPAFKGYKGYPASICASINEQVVHGIPSPARRLRDGDIISIDLGVKLDGFFGDSAITVGIGKISPKAAELLRVTEESLWKAIEAVRPGARVSDIGYAVQHHVEPFGFSVVRDRLRAARGAADSQLRRARPWAQAGPGYGAGDRADGERGRRRREGAAGRMDSGDRGRQSVGALRAHRRGDVGRCRRAVAGEHKKGTRE